MKRSVMGLLMGLMIAMPLTAMAEKVEVELSVPYPDVWEDDQGFAHVRIDGFSSIGSPGTPALPSRAVQVLLPPGHEVVSVNVIPAEAVEIPGSFLVFPVQRPLPISRGGQELFTEPDADIYTRDDAFPLRFEEIPITQRKRGFVIQPVVVSPVSYKPMSGTLSYSPWVTISVTTAPQKALVAAELATYRGFQRDFEQVIRLVDNPDVIQAYPLATGHTRAPDYRYVIVTNQALAGCSGGNNLQALASNKESRGLPTLIKTVEDIRSEYSGQDDAEKVRNFIKDMYDNHGADFVLIAGDDDLEIYTPGGGETEETIVPVRGLFGTNGYDTEDDNIPSDLYYACLDGNFNSDGDNKWGESSDNTDLLSEVWVGRAPVDNCTEVSNFVSKTLAYQGATGLWLKNVYMVGEWLWESQPSFGKDYLYHVEHSSTDEGLDTKGFSESSFFTVSGLYDKDQTGANCQGQPSPCWDVSDVLSVLNGSNHIINHLGHSYTYYNMRMVTDQADQGLNNNEYFFEYSQGCYPGAFDNRLDPQEGNEVIWQDSYAEHLVLGSHGAFAAVMNSRYGWGGVSNYFHRTFWDGAFRSGMNRLGELHANGREMLSGNASNPYFRWVYYESILFGDPEVALHMQSSTTTPQIAVDETEPWFMAIHGGDNPKDQSLNISNVGGGTLNWTISSDAAWLSASPATGTAPSEVALSVDANGLDTDHYEATLTIEAPGATNSPFTIPVTLYIIAVPSTVAPYFEGTAPVVDGTIGASEYTGAMVIEMGSYDEQTNTMRMMHNGSVLYMAFDLGSDTDDDPEDSCSIYFDVNADDLWPTSQGDEGIFLVLAGYLPVFAPIWNPGTGVEVGDGQNEPAGVANYGGMSGGHRVIEASIDLTSSHLVRSAGQIFSTFIICEDYNSSTEQWDSIAIWPYGLGTWDTTEYFGDVTLGTDTDNLVVNPVQLSFAAEQDSEPTDWENLTIASTTTNALNFTITKNGSWVQLSETSGTTPAVVRVWADPSGVSAGTQNGSLQITVAGVDTVNVPVSFDVAAMPPAFGLNPAGLYFTTEKDTILPPSQTVSVTNTSGSGTLNWTATPVGSWFTVTPSSGTGAANISVRPNTTDLDAGFHTGAIMFTAPGAEPAQVEVSYTITVPPILAVNPTEIVRQDPIAAGPVELELQIINAELGTMNWTVMEFSPWITLDPTGGNAVTGHPGRVTVTLDPATLGVGTHEADITCTAPMADNSPVMVHVAWTLVDAAAIEVSPTSLAFQGTVGGGNPSAQTLQISNIGPGSLNWSVACDDTWLTCNPASGAAPGSVSVNVTTAGLAEGLHNGSIVVTSAEAANSPVTVPVSVTMTGGGQNRPPPAPQLVSPPHQAQLDLTSPELTIQNVTDPDGDTVNYSFEVYEKGSGQPSIVLNNIIQGEGNMTYTNLNASLVKGITYQWRARAVDEHGAAGTWSEYWEFTITGEGGGGCGCTTSNRGSWGGVLLFGLLLGLAVIRKR